jgi:hypothetical protein
MNAANNHPSVQNAKQTVMNGKVCAHVDAYMLWTTANSVQISESCAHDHC